MAVITSPVSGQTLTDLTPKGVMNLLYTDIERLTAGADIEFDYPEFERSVREYGGLIMESRMPASQGASVDKNAQQWKHAYFDESARYYQDWTEKVYQKEIRRVDLFKILDGEIDYSDYISRIARANLEGFKDETNQGIEEAMWLKDAATSEEVNSDSLIITNDSGTIVGGLLYHESTGDFPAFNFTPDPTEATYGKFFSMLLRVAFNMARANSTYTKDGGRYGVRISDLAIYIPDDIYAQTYIQYVQKLENMEGMSRLPVIRRHGLSSASFDVPTNFAFILDKRVISHVTRYMKNDVEDFDPSKSTMLSLHVDDMIKTSPLYKGYALKLEIPNPA